MLSQVQSPCQDKTQIIKSQVKVGFTVQVRYQVMSQKNWEETKLNELSKRTGKKQNRVNWKGEIRKSG